MNNLGGDSLRHLEKVPQNWPPQSQEAGVFIHQFLSLRLQNLPLPLQVCWVQEHTCFPREHPQTKPQGAAEETQLGRLGVWELPA